MLKKENIKLMSLYFYIRNLDGEKCSRSPRAKKRLYQALAKDGFIKKYHKKYIATKKSLDLGLMEVYKTIDDNLANIKINSESLSGQQNISNDDKPIGIKVDKWEDIDLDNVDLYETRVTALGYSKFQTYYGENMQIMLEFWEMPRIVKSDVKINNSNLRIIRDGRKDIYYNARDLTRILQRSSIKDINELFNLPDIDIE